MRFNTPFVQPAGDKLPKGEKPERRAILHEGGAFPAREGAKRPPDAFLRHPAIRQPAAARLDDALGIFQRLTGNPEWIDRPVTPGCRFGQ